MVRALGALVTFLESGADVPSDPNVWPPALVIEYEDLLARQAGQPPAPGSPASGQEGISGARERPPGAPGPPARPRGSRRPRRASGARTTNPTPNPDKKENDGNQEG